MMCRGYGNEMTILEFSTALGAAFPQNTDPILGAIGDFRAGFADYNANAPHDNEGARAYAETSYRKPRRVLLSWQSPALTREGAIAALRTANEAQANDDHALVGPLLSAALAYFEENC